MKFGTNPEPSKSKTKCIIFLSKPKDHIGVANITLDGVPLPWVRSVSHLGCTLDSENTMKQDIALKHGRYVGKVNSLLQEIHFADKDIILKLLNTSTTSFYGSPLWDLYSASCDKLYKSWNVTMRNVLDVDRRTHRYFLHGLTEQVHPKVMLASQLVSFYKAQLSSPKFRMRFLVHLAVNDKRTVLGSNLERIAGECGCGIEQLTSKVVKSRLGYVNVPNDQEWRVHLASELYDIRNESRTIPGFSSDEIECMLQYVCIS